LRAVTARFQLRSDSGSGAVVEVPVDVVAVGVPHGLPRRREEPGEGEQVERVGPL